MTIAVYGKDMSPETKPNPVSYKVVGYFQSFSKSLLAYSQDPCSFASTVQRVLKARESGTAKEQTSPLVIFMLSENT